MGENGGGGYYVGLGGDGEASTFSGSSVTYGRGGDGAFTGTANGADGATDTGGGGSAMEMGGSTGGDGADGIIMIRYLR